MPGWFGRKSKSKQESGPVASEAGSRVAVSRQCRWCGGVVLMQVDKAEYALYEQGKLLAGKFSGLTADEREILISGMCGTCFDRLIPPDRD